jgi:hypothetical protein
MFLFQMWEIINQISTDYNSLIKYAGAALIFFYFIEGWNLIRILIYLLVLICVIIFMNYDNLQNHFAKLIPQKQETLPIATKPTITDKLPEIKELPAELKELTRYIMEIKEGVDDPSYARVINAIDILVISYNDQVAKLFDDFEAKRGFYHHTVQNIKDIQRDLYEEIQGLYFKVETDQYMEVASRLQAIEAIMDKLDVRIEEIVNADFKADINCNKATINLVGTPAAYEDQHF